MGLCHGSDVGKPDPEWLRGAVGWWKGELCASWAFPAARGSGAGDVGQAGSVGFSQHTQTSQLKALAVIHFTPVCKDFMSAFSSHHFQLWFGVCFILLLSILSCAGGNSQLDAEAVKLVGWEFSSALGSAFSSRAGLGKDLVAVPTSLPAGQTGETGTGLGQLLGSWELLLSPAPAALRVSPTGWKSSCSADIKYQEVQITPNLQL